MSRIPLFVELCAGTAAVSLRLHGGRRARPPVSRMGSKRGYAHAILWACGLRSGQGADRYLWCEPDPGVRTLLEAYRDPELARQAAAIIRGWAGEEPRALWERLRAEGPPTGHAPREVARWAWVQARTLHGQAFKKRQHPDGHYIYSDHFPAERMENLPRLPAAIHDDARTIEPQALKSSRRINSSNPLAVYMALPRGTVVYIDPPYVDTAGYAHALPREEVVALARRWQQAGALVCVSEQEPLPELMRDGWHALDITSARVGSRRTFSRQQAEYLTMSEPPQWRPEWSHQAHRMQVADIRAAWPGWSEGERACALLEEREFKGRRSVLALGEQLF